MKKFLLPAGCVALALAVSACGTPRNHYAPDYTGTISHYRYACADGTILPVRFEGDIAVVRLWDGTEIIMDQAPTASGFRYVSGQHELRGAGRDATWTVGRRVATDCRA